jgi:putative peptidoglycan lipid II flippase
LKTLRKSAVTSAIGIAGSLLSFANQMVLAARFGASVEMDAYVLGISGPLFVIGVAAGALGYLLVPEFSRRAPAERSAFAAALGTAVFGLGAAVALAAIALPGAGGEGRAIAVLGWLWLPPALVATVYNACCSTQEIFYRPALLQFAPVAGAVTAALAAGPGFGVVAVVWGQLIGYACWAAGAAACAGPAAPRRADWRGTRDLLRQTPLALCGLLVFTVYPASDAYWGARIGPAAVSHLAYGQRIIVGVTGIFVFGASAVVFARMARSVREGDPAAADAETALFVKTVAACVLPVALLLGCWSVPLTRELLQRGSFAAGDTAALGSLLAVVAVGIVPMAAMNIVFRALYARRRVGAAAALSAGATLAYIALSGWLHRPWGSPGIGAAYAATWWGLLAASGAVLWRGSAFAAGSYFRQAVLQLGAAAVPAAAAAWLSADWVAADGALPGRWLRLGTAGAAVLAVYAAAACAAVPEIRAAAKRLVARGD